MEDKTLVKERIGKNWPWLVLVVVLVLGLTYFGWAASYGKLPVKWKFIPSFNNPKAGSPLKTTISVNGKTINEVEYKKRQGYIEKISAKTGKVFQVKDLTDSLIQELLTAEYAKNNQISVSDQEIADKYKSVVDQVGGDYNMKMVLNDYYGMDEESFRELVGKELLAQKVTDKLGSAEAYKNYLDEARKTAKIEINLPQ